MTKEDIEKILKQHKEKEGQLNEVELKIDEYTERLEYAGTVYKDSENEVIENMQLKGQAYSDTKGNTNKISDKVPTTAMKYKEEVNHVNREDRNFLEAEIEKLKKRKRELNRKIVRVKSWLNNILEEEAFILTEFYINNKGQNWNKVVIEYNKNHRKELSDRQLRNKRDDAIEKILKIVNI